MTSNLHEKSGDLLFSIIIPTWNNLSLLKCCVHSIEKNSVVPYEIIVHVNEGKDGTIEWLHSKNIVFTHSKENIGICKALNQAANLSNATYIVYLNDDMVVCPGWDAVLWDKIQTLPTNLFMLSSTMIEPRESGNECVLVQDFGSSPESLKEEKLVKEYQQTKKADWYGATWPPCVVHKYWWHKVGGYSEEFSPGMSSDNDFSMKMWQEGCRIFLGLGNSRVYHFMSKSTGKVVRNNGRQQFLKKWGLTQTTFDRHYLRRGQLALSIELPDPNKTVFYYFDHLRSKLKLLIN